MLGCDAFPEIDIVCHLLVATADTRHRFISGTTISLLALLTSLEKSILIALLLLTFTHGTLLLYSVATAADRNFKRIVG